MTDKPTGIFIRKNGKLLLHTYDPCEAMDFVIIELGGRATFKKDYTWTVS